MNLAGLAWRYLWARPLSTALNLALLGLGVGLMVFLLLVSQQIERSLQRDLSGIDLVVGAKGSPMQLMLAGVFHLDVPTGNIPLAAVAQLRAQPMVAYAVPVALGDAIHGFRIVGTDAGYLDLYGAALDQGRRWQSPMEVVVGAAAAAELAVAMGARLTGSHGLSGEGQLHAGTPYTVVGILRACGCVLDRLLLTSLDSVWAVHEHREGVTHDGEPARAADAKEVTLVLLRYRSPLAAAMMPRWVNAQPGLQSASPPLETARLFRLIGVGADVLRGFAALLIVVSLLSVFVALVHAVREREADLAVMRMLGAPPRRLAALVALEAAWLAALGAIIGLALGHALAQASGLALARERSLPISGWYWTSDELWCIVAVLALALLAAAVPAWRVGRLEVARLLQAPH